MIDLKAVLDRLRFIIVTLNQLAAALVAHALLLGGHSYHVVAGPAGFADTAAAHPLHDGLVRDLNRDHVVKCDPGLFQGRGLGAIIGRRGETLDAIQQLTNYAVNSGADKRIRVHVDAENYRAKREQSLESLARKVAAKVTKYRRSVTLEPMNAYERHVIHAALQDKAGVTTYSVGTEPNRRVVIAPKGREE
mgnify:CR=1 FL=1